MHLPIRFPLCLSVAALCLFAQTTETEWEQQARAIPDAARIRSTIEKLSAQPHLAGTPGSKQTADWLLAQLREFGLDAHVETFEALLPTPKTRILEMTAPSQFQAKLEEANTAGVPPYNAYSGDGDVTAPLVYANYGLPADYDTLKERGIDVKGKIVLVRYGAAFRGVKPRVAYEHGAIGCIIYSDPRDDGYYRGDVLPKGPYRPADGVQRGSVVDLGIQPGDPLTPGWASEPGAKRLTLAEAKTMQQIPVLPISWGDAQPLLAALGGPVAPETWRGALPNTYHLGPSVANVHLKVEMDNGIHPLYDVIATIPGTEFPDEWILHGNHHDAWVGGASDPLSGAAPLLETARSLAELSRRGWKPRRTIMLAFWDGEEFGLMGSTEWMEEHADELNRKLAVYINSDSSGKGTLSAGGSDTLDSFVRISYARSKIPPPANRCSMPIWQPARRKNPWNFTCRRSARAPTTRRSCSIWVSHLSVSVSTMPREAAFIIPLMTIFPGSAASRIPTSLTGARSRK